MEEIIQLITFRNVVDVTLVALIAYYAYRLLRKSGAVNLFWGLLSFVVVWFLTRYVFHLPLTSALFNQIISVGAIAIIVIFQKELRSFFYSVGSHMGKGIAWGKMRQMQDMQHQVSELFTALMHMSENKQGALIVLIQQQLLDEFADTGEQVDAEISARLIENIFYKNSPLHDGAMFLSHGRIRCAACILPVSSNKEIPKQLGLRHRAAVGLTEKTDAVAIVVSEQTGAISLAKGEEIRTITSDELMTTLKQYMV